MSKPSTQKVKHFKKPSSTDMQRQQICDLAARIIHEEGIRDFQKAKLRACDALHFKSNSYLPTNEEIQHALENRISLFESIEVKQTPFKLTQLQIAGDMLAILNDYQARLTGHLLLGFRLKHSPIEIHCFCNTAELVCDELNWRGISAHLVEKRYRYQNTDYVNVPLVICQFDNQDIEISIFKEKELHRSPICPNNGKPFQRVSLRQLTNQHPNLLTGLHHTQLEEIE